jgi:hypothetical protein
VHTGFTADAQVHVKPVVAIKALRISVNNGFSLKTAYNSIIEIEPDLLEVKRVLNLWKRSAFINRFQ